MTFAAPGVLCSSVALASMTVLCAYQQPSSRQSHRKETQKMQVQESEKIGVRRWLFEAPFDDPKALAANPNFSYEKWLDTGRKLPRVVDVLIELLHEENASPTMSGERIAYALGWIGDSRATKELLSALRGKDQVLRAESATALGRIGDRAAVGPLTKLVEDEKEESNVRANACIGLGHLGGPEALAVLRKAVKDRDAFVARAAEAALGR